MRTYNEVPLSVAAKGLTRKSKEEFLQTWKVAREKILVECANCKKEHLVSQGKLHKYYKNSQWTCYDCFQKKKAEDKKEMNQALINLAKSKGLIK